jgi:hypothetical protein
VKDLAEAMTQAGRDAEFQACLVKLLSVHGKRGAWMKRLDKAGIHVGEIYWYRNTISFYGHLAPSDLSNDTLENTPSGRHLSVGRNVSLAPRTGEQR